jgi:Spy/CpxP family protein refolding chaperone
MNKWKAFVAVAGLMIGSALLVAQDAGPKAGSQNPGEGARKGRQGPGARGGRMGIMRQLHEQALKQLNLTPEQKKKIAAADKGFAREMQALAEKAQKQQGSGAQAGQEKGAPKAGRIAGGEFRRLREAHGKEIAKILTPEQNKKYREFMMEKMRELRERREGERGAGKGAGKARP